MAWDGVVSVGKKRIQPQLLSLPTSLRFRIHFTMAGHHGVFYPTAPGFSCVVVLVG